jgi:hypothetical protein
MKNKPITIPGTPDPTGGTGLPTSIPQTTTTNPFPFPLPPIITTRTGGGNRTGTGDGTGTNTGGTGSSTSRMPGGGDGTSTEDYQRATEYLAELAMRTGGRVSRAATTANLALAFSNIAAELRQLYSIGYYPKEEGKPGQKRRIKVRTDKPGFVVKARDSYVVPKKVKK